MFTLFGTTVAEILILCGVLMLYAAPVLLAWAAVRFLRDVRRIADALQYTAPPKVWADAVGDAAMQDTFNKAVRRVSNSAFGR